MGNWIIRWNFNQEFFHGLGRIVVGGLAVVGGIAIISGIIGALTGASKK